MRKFALMACAALILSVVVFGEDDFETRRKNIRTCFRDWRGDYTECENSYGNSEDGAICKQGADEAFSACLDAALTGANAVFVDLRVLRDNGKPEVFEMNFTVAVSGTYSLLILNGVDDAERLSSLLVAIDGQRVAGPDCFNQRTGIAEALVPLTAGEHVLRVEARSRPGGAVSLGMALMDRAVLSVEDRCPTDRH
jgi:hypothetical protein